MKMNTLKTISAWLLASILFCGCSTPPTFTEYHSKETYQGMGGEVRSVDGVDFWENGEPDRRYVILGLVGEPAKKQAPVDPFSKVFTDAGGSSARDSAIAKVAHDHGGDAVIIVTQKQAVSSKGPVEGAPHPSTTLAVVKYVE
jgi:hypothetical protein